MKPLYTLAKTFQRQVEGLFEAKGQFPYGNCIVRYNFDERSAAIEVYNPVKDRYLDRIADWLIQLIQPCDKDYNEWVEHGFRDEEDYITYKYR